ncbi:MAG: 4-hydroxy-tetrahydrodipicolinate reductase [Coprobacillaceae bacterium]
MNIIVYGYGLMGKKVATQVRKQKDMILKGVVSYVFDEKAPEPMYQSLQDVKEKVDIVIDFSHPNNLNDILDYALKNKTKVVFATTGYTSEQIKQIEEASKQIAIFQSYNTSLGVQIITKILREIVSDMYENDFDIEILEKHHNQKIDAPSGTAKLLYEVINEEIPEVEAITDRSQLSEKRKRNEVGLQAIRGGTIFGEHTIYFAGNDEVIELKHTALSKEVFVQGAINAARLLKEKDAGLYSL